jgi:hypothetical protein
VNVAATWAFASAGVPAEKQLAWARAKWRLAVLALTLCACLPATTASTSSSPTPDGLLQEPPSQTPSGLPPTSSLEDMRATADVTQGGTLQSQFLYSEHEYYQREGIPPYVSFYVEMDSVDKQWVDMNDPNRFRQERRFRTREAEPREGFEFTVVGTGRNGLVERCEYYEGKSECVQQPATNVADYREWLDNLASPARNFQNNQDSPQALGGYNFKGTETTSAWGEVLVFEREVILQASDIYPNQPTREVIKFDNELLRRVEWVRYVITDEGEIVHASYRLVTWTTLDETELSAALFTTSSP